jgi:hypothetical protein
MFGHGHRNNPNDLEGQAFHLKQMFGKTSKDFIIEYTLNLQ